MTRTASTRRYLLGAILCLVFFGIGSVLVPEALAQTGDLQTVGEASGLGGTDIRVIIANIIRVILGTLGVIAVVLIIYAGFLWMTSAGNDEKVERAKNILKSAVIGLTIILASLAIVTFVLNALLGATGLGGGVTPGGGPPTETLSDALGSGAIEDHYPSRNATGIPRNTKMIVTFKEAMNIPSFIVGYNTAGTATDTSDDTAPATPSLDTDNVTITCLNDDGTEDVLTSGEVTVTFTEDIRTFVFDPPVLGSAVTPTTCTVGLGPDILDATGAPVFVGRSSEGYEWSFEVSTELDLTPPTVTSVIPDTGSTFARNIIVHMEFSEALDPTAVTGSYSETSGGFTHIQVRADVDGDGTFSPVAGTYGISSGYTVVEFTPEEACGFNTCGFIIYCLPDVDVSDPDGLRPIELDIQSATLSAAPPEAVAPPDGVVDLVGNALDGNDDGTAGDDYPLVTFSITGEEETDAPVIESVSPAVLEPDVSIDQDVVIVWDTFMRSSTLTNSVFSMLANPDHEMWYTAVSESVDTVGEPITLPTQTPVKTKQTIFHGVFLDSVDDDPNTVEVDETYSQLYATNLPEGIQSLYQNCFYPATGPDDASGTCSGTTAEPYCCDGSSQATGFDTTSFSCL